MRDGLLVAGKYRLVKMLGSGGMGSVWIARHEMTEREFAIKFLHREAACDAKIVARFLQEARVSGRLRHPSILEIFDVGTAPELGGAPFLVMELLEGAPLDAAVRAGGGLPVRFALLVARDLARALAVAHDKGVVHRDIKPANVYLHRAPSGGVVPKLLDFGISKLEKRGESIDHAVSLTHTGAVLGSPLYMSPEQAAGRKDVDGRSDVHAMGVMLWECIVGRVPYEAQTYNTLVVEIMTGDRPKLEEHARDASAGLAQIVERAFARDRAARWQSAREMAEAIDAEISAMGAGPGLDSPDWVGPIVDRARASSGKQRVDEHATTTGAVSVPLATPDVTPSGRSPAASTLASEAASVAPTLDDRDVRPAARATKGPARAVTWSVAAVAVVAIAAVSLIAMRPHREGASPSPSGPPSLATPANASAAAIASAPPLESAPAPATAASSAPAQRSRPPAAAQAGTIASPAPRPSASADPHRGVTSSGL